jgi:hypothetical protein
MIAVFVFGLMSKGNGRAEGAARFLAAGGRPKAKASGF